MSTDDDGRRNDPIAILVAFVSGVGGSFGYQYIDPPRPDPYTGSEARKMERRIDSAVDMAERALSNSEAALADHRDTVQNFYEILRDHERSYHFRNSPPQP